MLYLIVQSPPCTTKFFHQKRDFTSNPFKKFRVAEKETKEVDDFEES